MRANPKPDDATLASNSQRAVAESHAHGPKIVNALEMKRGMFGVTFEKLKILVGEIAYSLRKAPIVGPEFRASKVLQSGVQFPESKSFLA